MSGSSQLELAFWPPNKSTGFVARPVARPCHDGIESIIEQDAVGRLATVRLTRPSKPQAPVIDLLFASSGIEREVVAEAEAVEVLPNLTIGVARTGHLIALIILSRDDIKRGSQRTRARFRDATVA